MNMKQLGVQISRMAPSNKMVKWEKTLQDTINMPSREPQETVFTIELSMSSCTTDSSFQTKYKP